MSGSNSEYIQNARQLAAKGLFKKSLDLYCKELERSPHLRNAYQAEFYSNLKKLSESSSKTIKFEDTFAIFRRAVDIFPDSLHLANEIGKYLYKHGYFQEARSQFQKALSIDAGYVKAEKNLNILKNLMVQKCHFRILNDKIRNDSYREAIHERVTRFTTRVLDLSTGTGILAMYAAEQKPKSIIACVGSETMASLTEYLLEENMLAMTVSVINKVSTALDYGELSGKCAILLTDMFDAGLFGERILSSLSHAWESLLGTDGEVVPKKAEFFIMGANSELLNSKYQLCAKTKDLLNIPNLDVRVRVTGEKTYECDDVHFYKDIKYMTEPESVIKIDFNNLADIKEKLNNSEPRVVQLKATQQGQINSFIGWFNLYLTDNITITTDPRAENRANAWQQAVFYDNSPSNVEQNDTFDVEFTLQSEKLIMKPNGNCDMRISSETMRFLNDTEYLETIKNCIGMSSVHLGQMAEMSEIDIADVSPFPIFGLLMLKRGIHTLVCYAKTSLDRLFIEEILTANNISSGKVAYLIGDERTPSITFGEDKYHAVFCHILDSCGEVDTRRLEEALCLKSSHLIHGGLFIPANVTLMGQVVFSNWLDQMNRAHDKNVGYKISVHVNKYQVSQNFGLDFTHMKYTPLTDAFSLGNCFHLAPKVINVLVKSEGYANAIICWYSIELMENLGEISTKRAFSFADGTAFLAYPVLPMDEGDVANVVRCVDSDGAFKLILDVESE